MPNDAPASSPSAIRSLSAPELMAMDLPAPRTIIESGPDSGSRPILTSKSLALLTGPRGIGKTFVALGIAWAAATGGRFLGWQAPQARRVVYIDGEMAAAELRDRMRLFSETPKRSRQRFRARSPSCWAISIPRAKACPISAASRATRRC